MLKILGRKNSSNVQKALWCCAELGLNFKREDVGGQFGKNREPEYLALNPNGLIPTVIDGDFVLQAGKCLRQARPLSAPKSTRLPCGRSCCRPPECCSCSRHSGLREKYPRSFGRELLPS